MKLIDVNDKITDFLKKDNEEVKSLKSIYKKEQEYNHILYALEVTVAEAYLLNKKLKDKDVIDYFNNFSKNLDKKISYFKSRFEQDLCINVIGVLENEPITEHELKLCIKHILWSIDNRSWLNDPQAYIKWLANAMDLLEPKEKEAYHKKVRKLCSSKGISKKK